jgi:hypothetical protein
MYFYSLPNTLPIARIMEEKKIVDVHLPTSHFNSTTSRKIIFIILLKELNKNSIYIRG